MVLRNTGIHILIDVIHLTFHMQALADLTVEIDILHP